MAVTEQADDSTSGIDSRAETLAVAEAQLEDDRAAARRILKLLGTYITERKKAPTCQALACLNWLERRITEIETDNVALWCEGCAAENHQSVEPPPGPWMVRECLEHAEEMLARTAKSLERSLFA